MTTSSTIPSALPPLPPATQLPWSADTLEAYHGLASAFLASRRALNLDESDPIRLNHHLKQAETFMASIIDVLSVQPINRLPAEYVKKIRESVASLTNGLRSAYKEATLAWVISPSF
jgi:hypothetical protein